MSHSHRKLTRTWRKHSIRYDPASPSGDCSMVAITYHGIPIHWDEPSNETEAYLIGERATANIEAFQSRYGRMPIGVTEALAAMLHGAEAEACHS